MANYAKIYMKFLEKENTVGLTAEEAGMKQLVEAVLISAMQELEDKSISGDISAAITLENLRNLLITNSTYSR